MAECLKYATGVDLIDGAVRAALDIPVIGISQKPYQECWAEVILHSDKKGIFRGLWISDSIRKNVVETDIWVSEGEEVFGFDSANKAIGTLVMNFDNTETLETVMKDVSAYVKVQLEEDI